MTILDWFYLIILLIIGGYIYNRVIFWVGAFIWQWCENVIFGHFWFYKGTTIKDICNFIKYTDKYDHSGSYDEESYLNDTYDMVYHFRWFPGINILISSGVFIVNLLGLVLALLIIIIRLLIIIILFIWKYGLKYIYNSIKYCFNKFLNFLYYIHLNSFIKYLFNICINIKDKILNFKIA